MTRTQIQKLFLCHRDSRGHLNLDALLSEDRVLEQQEKGQPDKFASHRRLRRMQGLPDYLIDAEIDKMEAAQTAAKEAKHA